MAAGSIIIELGAEDRARIDRLIAALEQGRTEAPRMAQDAPAPEPEQKPTEPAPAAEEPAPPVTLAQVQALVVQISSTHQELKAKVREIVKAHAERVSAIPAEELGTVYEELKKLEA